MYKTVFNNSSVGDNKKKRNKKREKYPFLNEKG